MFFSVDSNFGTINLAKNGKLCGKIFADFDSSSDVCTHHEENIG